MAINKVEYIKDSLRAGFATAGEEVTINKSSAQTIKEDSEAGNTENLTSAQNKYLKTVMPQNDNTDYETGDSPESLPEDETNATQDNKQKSENTTNENISAAASTATLMFGAALLTSGKTLSAVMNSVTAPVVGGIDVALAAASIAGVATFDSNYNARMAEKNAAGEYITTLNEYAEKISADLATNQDTTVYEEAGAEAGAAAEEATKDAEAETVSTEEQINQLTAELEQYKAEGNQEKIDEITAKIETLQNGGKSTEGAKEKISPKDMLAQVQANNQEAHDIGGYIGNVASVLQEGTNLGALGTMNAVALAGCSAISAVLAVKAYRGANIFTLVQATIGAALCGTAAGIFAGSATAMGIKAANEFKCGNAGKEIQTSMNTLAAPLQQHDTLVSSLAEEVKKSEETTEETTETPETAATAETAETTATTTEAGAGTGTVAPTGGTPSSGGTTASSSPTSGTTTT